MTTATVAFTLKRFGKSEVHFSQGRVETGTRTVSIDDGWDEAEDDQPLMPNHNSYAAPGARIVTQAVEFWIEPDGPWMPGPILSFIWALRKALPIWLVCSDSDFELTWTIYPDHLRVLLADTKPGSNGISHNLWNSLQRAPDELEEIIQDDILGCSCNGLCERCLLLPRTPEPYVRKGFLHRNHLRQFLGGFGDAR